MVSKRSGASGNGLERLCTESPFDWMRSTDAVNGMELLEAWFHGRAYHPHRHDTYAIGLTEIGVQAFTYRGAAEISTPGKVVVLHPDERHDGHAATEEGFGYRMLYVEPALIFEAVHVMGAWWGVAVRAQARHDESETVRRHRRSLPGHPGTVRRG